MFNIFRRRAVERGDAQQISAADALPSIDRESGHFGFHPLANEFPLIEGAAFDELVASIRRDGQLEAIILVDGKILDGRNRYRACKVAGVEPRFVEFEGADPEMWRRYSAARNLTRRHLTTRQRAVIAGRLAAGGMEIEAAATAMAVGRATVTRAKALMLSGDTNIIDLVERGALGVAAGYDRVAGTERTSELVHVRKVRRTLDAVEALLATDHSWPDDVRARAVEIAALLDKAGRTSVAA